MTVEDLRAFPCGRTSVPANAALVVVGDVTPDGASSAARGRVRSWRPQGAPAVVAPVGDAPQLNARQVVIIDKPGATQSQIAIGGVGVSRATPDYFRLEVLNTILGGSFTSRLNQNLREQHGTPTAPAPSRFSMTRSAGPFIASSSVQTEVTTEALKEFFIELTGI